MPNSFRFSSMERPTRPFKNETFELLYLPLQLDLVTFPSSSGLGQRPFTAPTGVRLPLGTPKCPFCFKRRKGHFFIANPITQKANTLDNTTRSEMLKKVRQFILENPSTSFTTTTESLKLPGLTTIQFYNIKAQLRRKGKLMDSGVKQSDGLGNRKSAASNSTRIEILHTVDVTGFTPEILEHYKTGILPLLRRLVPEGKGISLVFLSDPPAVEIRRIVS